MNQSELIKYAEQFYAEALLIMKNKNCDYATSGDAFSNFKLTEAFKVTTTEAGIFTRLTDKLSRIAQYIRTGKFKVNEDIKETARDGCNYLVILSAYLTEKEEELKKKDSLKTS